MGSITGIKKSWEDLFGCWCRDCSMFFLSLSQVSAQNHQLQKHTSPEQLYQQGMACHALQQRSSIVGIILLLLSLHKKRSGWPDSPSTGCSHWHSVGMKIPLQTFFKQWTLRALRVFTKAMLRYFQYYGRQEHNKLLRRRIARVHCSGLFANSQHILHF